MNGMEWVNLEVLFINNAIFDRYYYFDVTNVTKPQARELGLCICSILKFQLFPNDSNEVGDLSANISSASGSVSTSNACYTEYCFLPVFVVSSCKHTAYDNALYFHRYFTKGNKHQ